MMKVLGYIIFNFTIIIFRLHPVHCSRNASAAVYRWPQRWNDDGVHRACCARLEPGARREPDDRGVPGHPAGWGGAHYPGAAGHCADFTELCPPGAGKHGANRLPHPVIAHPRNHCSCSTSSESTSRKGEENLVLNFDSENSDTGSIWI